MKIQTIGIIMVGKIHYLYCHLF